MSRPNSETGKFRPEAVAASSSTDRHASVAPQAGADVPPPIDPQVLDLLRDWTNHPNQDPRFRSLAALFRAAAGLPPDPVADEATPLRQSTTASATTSPEVGEGEVELFPEDDNDEGPLLPQPPVTATNCPGCDTYDCILAVHQDPLGVDAEAWFITHGFFSPCCPFHGMDKVNSKGECRARVDAPGGYCRKVCNKKPDMKTLWIVMYMMAVGTKLTSLYAQTKKPRGVIGPMVSRIAKGALMKSQQDRPKFTRFAVDETCIGRRKNNRGKRARSRNYWFWTATCINEDGSAGPTVFEGTPRRTLLLAQQFVRSVLFGTRCTVYTDSAKC